MGFFNFKKTKEVAENAVVAVDDAADEVQSLANNINMFVKDNERAVKIGIALALGGLAIGIISDVISIACCCSTMRSAKKPVIINNYMGGKKFK